MPGWSLPGGGVGRGEPPAIAVLRELREEIGLIRSSPPEFFGLYMRRAGWASNLVVLYRVRDAEFAFKPNFEIREVRFVDPAKPLPGTTAGTRRRLEEILGKKTPGLYW